MAHASCLRISPITMCRCFRESTGKSRLCTPRKRQMEPRSWQSAAGIFRNKQCPSHYQKVRRTETCYSRLSKRAVRDVLRRRSNGGELLRELPRELLRRFGHFQNAIRGHVLQGLHDSRGPTDFDKIRAVVRTEAEMHGAIARRRIADAGGHVVVLRAALRHQLDARADAVAVALGSTQRYVKPMAGVLAAVHPDFSIFPQSRYHDVDASVS